jgi:hypothetical protein
MDQLVWVCVVIITVAVLKSIQVAMSVLKAFECARATMLVVQQWLYVSVQASC